MARTKTKAGLAANVRRLGLTRGLLGGQRGWMALGGVFWLARLFRRAISRTEHTVALERLLPGQSMTLTAITPDSRRTKRRAKRAITKSAGRKSAGRLE